MEKETAVPGEEKESAPASIEEWIEPLGMDIDESSRACTACSGSHDIECLK